MSRERWKPVQVAGFGSAYQVSNRANVRSLQRLAKRSGRPYFVKGGRLRPSYSGGSAHVVLSVNGRRHPASVHALFRDAWPRKDFPDVSPSGA